MKVIIAGSRTVADDVLIRNAVETSGFDITEVVSGCARGADIRGERWAAGNGKPVKRSLADWDQHGKRAGVIRNRQMGDYADALIAVWDGDSTGTRHMIDYMTKLKKPVHVLRFRAGVAIW